MASAWYDGAATNPGANTVIVDTGALSSNLGTVTVQVVVNANITATFLIQHRNAANDANLHEQEVTIIANAPFTFGGFTRIFQDDERLRVLNKGAIVLGRVSASIFLS